MRKAILLLMLLTTFGAETVRAEESISLVMPISSDQADKAVPSLARQLVNDYKNSDRDQYLNQLFRLQQASGDYEGEKSSIRELRLIRNIKPDQTPLYLQYEIYAETRILQKKNVLSYEAAYRQAFRKILPSIGNRAAQQAQFSFGGYLPGMKDDLEKLLSKHDGKKQLALADALELVRKYQVYQAYKDSMSLADPLFAEDDASRYIIDKDILISTPDGAHVAAMMVRPRDNTAAQTALLSFTVYAKDEWAYFDAKKTASWGYAAIIAYTRGKGRSPDAVIPFEHDGDDARSVIDWITQQGWSDQRVGMYGGSYDGFTSWAATKKMPSALKAIMPSATVAPGIDVPMQGNIFQNFFYPWPLYVTNEKALDETNYNDASRWENLNKNWYSSGKSYRAMETMDKQPNPQWSKWLDHPGYDEYWQSMIPYRQEFAQINIPVLQTTGYFDGGQVGALYYANQHYRYKPNADNTFLIGPYEHLSMQTGVQRQVQGYAIDPVANIDLQALRYGWFDYIFKGGNKPEILKDKINYQVMGANQWKHAASLEAMHNAMIRQHLDSTRSDKGYRLAGEMSGKNKFIEHIVDFGDRSDVDWKGPELSINKTLDAHNGIAFYSDPVTGPVEVSGLFSAQLDFVVNKADFDFTIALYELSKEGDYMQLAYQVQRASFAGDRSQRKLLKPGKRQQLRFESERLTSRQLQAGSRFVIVLSINRQADQQINYGSGKDVSSESFKDAKTPLKIRWYGSSYVDIPVWK